GIDLERQLFIVQWALPLILSGIVFLDEFYEHIIEKKEPLITEPFLAEIFFFGVLGPTAVWLVLMWVRAEWRQREQEQKILQATYDELAAAQERLHTLHEQRGELLNRIMHIQEEERRRVAREIHDELGQLLTGLSLNLRVCRDAVPESLPQVRTQLIKINELVQQTIDQAHRIIVDLRPTALDDYGLVPALEEELHKRLDPLNIEVDMHVLGDVETLPPDHATAAFRIIQEAITNVIRHAQAQHVHVGLELRDEEFVVVVEDDGVGPVAATGRDGARRGIGILGMRERAAALGGKVEVTRREPQGTRVRLWLPVSPEERRRRASGFAPEPPGAQVDAVQALDALQEARS
ncbi:MAG: sensor histidine kinase, partial [Caldilineae bacterium]